MSYLKYNAITLWNDDGSTPNYVLAAETDLNGREHIIEPLGARTMNLYRGTIATNRAYTVVVKLRVTPGTTLTELKADWDYWHGAFQGECVVERETETGTVLQLDAVAETPQWGEEGPTWAEVPQVYTAANPWWRQETEQNASANYDDANPVNLACQNDGDMPTWVRLLIEGPVEDPKVVCTDEWELEFLLTVDVGETLEIICKTPAKAWLYPVYGARTRAYGYRTIESSFRSARLPVGNTNLILTATAGTGLCTAYWYHLYESLQ